MSADRIRDYHAIREGAAIGAVAPRAQIAVAGGDRAAYLQGLLTNDIQGLRPGSGCYAAWLTAQGRMITDMHVLQSEAMTLLDVPADLADAVLQRLDQFLFAEDVQLQSLADTLTGIWVHGPQAPDAVARVFGDASELASWAPYRHQRVGGEGVSVVVARIDQLGVPGFVLYVEQDRRQWVIDVLQAAGATEVGADAIAAARIEAGYPVFGIDMTDDTIPLEAGIEDRAISFTKGCYVGQEIIIRVLHRGGGRVARRLVGLRIAGNPPAPGAALHTGERQIGTVTSAAESPRLGTIALAYVHRDFVEPGTELHVDVDGTRVPATVTARPLPSTV